MRRPSERLAQRLARVSESFRQDPPIYVVDWFEVEHDDPRAETVEQQGNTVQIYASSREQYDHRRAELEQQLSPCRMICIVNVEREE